MSIFVESLRYLYFYIVQLNLKYVLNPRKITSFVLLFLLFQKKNYLSFLTAIDRAEIIAKRSGKMLKHSKSMFSEDMVKGNKVIMHLQKHYLLTILLHLSFSARLLVFHVLTFFQGFLFVSN